MFVVKKIQAAVYGTMHTFEFPHNASGDPSAVASQHAVQYCLRRKEVPQSERQEECESHAFDSLMAVIIHDESDS